MRPLTSAQGAIYVNTISQAQTHSMTSKEHNCDLLRMMTSVLKAQTSSPSLQPKAGELLQPL